MYFSTHSPYVDNDENMYISTVPKCDDPSAECFICFEYILDNYQKPSQLNNLHYIKQCSCNGFVHPKCLDIWFLQNNECPICRSSMYKRKSFISKIVKKAKIACYFIAYFFSSVVLIGSAIIIIISIYNLIENVYI